MISEALTSPETVTGVTECAFHRCVQGKLVRVRRTRHLGNRCVPADFGASGTLLGALARTLYGHLCSASFHPSNGYFFYNFCRTFGPALQHFLSDIHKKCLIVRQVRRISTPLHLSLCRMIRNGPLKISKSLKKAENGPFGKNLFPITARRSKIRCPHNQVSRQKVPFLVPKMCALFGS